MALLHLGEQLFYAKHIIPTLLPQVTQLLNEVGTINSLISQIEKQGTETSSDIFSII